MARRVAAAVVTVYRSGIPRAGISLQRKVVVQQQRRLSVATGDQKVLHVSGESFDTSDDD